MILLGKTKFDELQSSGKVTLSRHLNTGHVTIVSSFDQIPEFDGVYLLNQTVFRNQSGRVLILSPPYKAGEVHDIAEQFKIDFERELIVFADDVQQPILDRSWLKKMRKRKCSIPPFYLPQWAIRSRIRIHACSLQKNQGRWHWRTECRAIEAVDHIKRNCSSQRV